MVLSRRVEGTQPTMDLLENLFTNPGSGEPAISKDIYPGILNMFASPFRKPEIRVEQYCSILQLELMFLPYECLSGKATLKFLNPETINLKP
jgi:hypothetical protein